MPLRRRITSAYAEILAVVFLAWAVFSPAGLSAQTVTDKSRRLLSTITWQDGPCKAKLGELAEIEVPQGFRFTGPAGVRIWDELTGNPPSGGLGVLVPADLSWYLNFQYDNIGYVNDSKNNSLNSAVLLRDIQRATEEANHYRQRQGWSALRVIGWRQEPSYDSQQRKLTWALRGQTPDGEIVNYNTRLLGRSGVMSANLVISPERFEATTPLLKGILADFQFSSGHRYTEWRSGDRTAQNGLGALIVGGGAAVAAKTGLLAKLAAFLGAAWKPGILAAVALFTWLKRKAVAGKSSASQSQP